MKKSFISVIIPTLKISRFLIEENLPALNRQSYKYFEVIVLPNKRSKTDQMLLEKYPWLRIAATANISKPAQKRDIGVSRARGDIVAFIDDDAFPPKKWLEEAEKVFTKKRVEAICGPGILPPSAKFFEKVFDEVLKTYIGSGGFAYRFIKSKSRFVDDYPSMNFFIKKNVFKKIGGFNSDYWPGEDSKLCEDLVYKYNGRIYYDPKVYIYHHRRADPLGYLKQHGQYGYHRGAFFAHGDKNSRRLTYLIPTFFVIYLIASFLLLPVSIFYPLSSILYLPLLIYLILLFHQMIIAFKNTRSLKVSIFSSIVLFSMHVIYGIKFIQGFFVGIVKREKIYG